MDAYQDMGDEDCAIGVEEIAGVFVNGTCHCGNGEGCLCDVALLPALFQMELAAAGEGEFLRCPLEKHVGRLRPEQSHDQDIDGECYDVPLSRNSGRS